MKKLTLILTIFLASLTTQAATIAILEGSKAGIQRVELSDKGDLRIKYERGQTDKIIQLRPLLAADLLVKARELSYAVIETSLNPTPCDVTPAPRLETLKVSEYDFETNTFKPTFKSAYIKYFCSNTVFVSPKYKEDLQLAIELGAIMEALALHGK